jgi:AAA15 family ATPase/GTPase
VGRERYIFTRGSDGAIRAKKLLAGHLRSDGSEVLFELRREADGSQRVIDLLPAFCELSDPRARRVYVIDELDRSLHTLLTRRLLSSFLDTCGPATRSQLLFTTHDLLLMDQDLLRRDETWVTERDAQGASTVFSLSEYQEIRYDKDIRKSYLQGRLGGVPRLLYRPTCAADVPMAMEDQP